MGNLFESFLFRVLMEVFCLFLIDFSNHDLCLTIWGFDLRVKSFRAAFSCIYGTWNANWNLKILLNRFQKWRRSTFLCFKTEKGTPKFKVARVFNLFSAEGHQCCYISEEKKKTKILQLKGASRKECYSLLTKDSKAQIIRIP